MLVTFVSNVILMSSVTNVNKYQYIARPISSVEIQQRVLGMMGSKPSQVKQFFPAATMFLSCIMQRITIPKLCNFQNSVTFHLCMPLLQIGTSVKPTSQVSSPAILVLLIVQN
jgi:hypothetical protein